MMALTIRNGYLPSALLVIGEFITHMMARNTMIVYDEPSSKRKRRFQEANIQAFNRKVRRLSCSKWWIVEQLIV